MAGLSGVCYGLDWHNATATYSKLNRDHKWKMFKRPLHNWINGLKNLVCMPLPHTLAGDDGFSWDWISSVAAICIAKLQQILLITSNYFLKNSEGKQIQSDKLTLLQLHWVCSSIITCNLDKKMSDIKKITFYVWKLEGTPGHKALPPKHLAQHPHFKGTIG